MPAPGVTATLSCARAAVFVRFEGGDEAAVRADAGRAARQLDHVDALIEDGTIGGAELNAADFQIGDHDARHAQLRAAPPADRGPSGGRARDADQPQLRRRVPGPPAAEWIPADRTSRLVELEGPRASWRAARTRRRGAAARRPEVLVAERIPGTRGLDQPGLALELGLELPGAPAGVPRIDPRPAQLGPFSRVDDAEFPTTIFGDAPGSSNSPRTTTDSAPTGPPMRTMLRGIRNLRQRRHRLADRGLGGAVEDDAEGPLLRVLDHQDHRAPEEVEEARGRDQEPLSANQSMASILAAPARPMAGGRSSAPHAGHRSRRPRRRRRAPCGG